MATVLINLTYWVEGCADLPINDNRLWHWLFGVSATDVLTRACARLGKPVTAISLKSELHRTDIMARIDGQPKPVPLVTVCQGLSFSELNTALTALQKTEKQKEAA